MASIRKAMVKVMNDNPAFKDLIESCRGKSRKEKLKIIEQWQRVQKQVEE